MSKMFHLLKFNKHYWLFE